MKNESKTKLCVITTVSTSIKAFYQGQLKAFTEAGFEVTVICADDKELENDLPSDITFFPVSFSRVLSPLNDLMTVFALYKYFRHSRFDMVQYSTPKASLLGAIAAFLARVPIRIYILWGLYYMGQSGLKQSIFKFFERLIGKLSTNIVPISHEMVDFAVNEGIGKREKYEVMLNGSACGVDLNKVDPAKFTGKRKEIRDKHQIPESAIVVGVVARLTGDKGINELVEAFSILAKENENLYLLVVGTQEDKDRLDAKVENILNDHPRVFPVGWQSDPLPYYMAMDVFCLPTYREGFGEVNLEAQAMQLPVVSTDVIGPRESVDDGRTGFLVEVKSVDGLVGAIAKLIYDRNLREQMGTEGRERVRQMFDRDKMIEAVVEHRLNLASRFDTEKNLK